MSTRKRRKKPIDDAKTHILSCTDKVGFMSRYIDGYKGRGVFATPPNEPGDFVLEYRGKLLTKEECESRRYSETESKFLFGFKWQNHCLCLDASEEDGSLGRLVNDNHKNPNCVMKKIIVDNKPHLCLFSLKKIEIGAEIYYNYGDSKWPWRSKVGKNKAPAAAKENLLGGEGQGMPHTPSCFQSCSYGVLPSSKHISIWSLSFTHSCVSSLTQVGPFRPVLPVDVFSALW
ncbi:N-lysine methyltransferase KMT5A-A-like isoform X1 [Nothobranchius furzeri]|uniref:N-lysine methyltransferase KMT5A-A-like isoform X1 n=1 Tax=Nothobranchius furzeri TaxID=105023 RepID=UPI003904999B